MPRTRTPTTSEGSTSSSAACCTRRRRRRRNAWATKRRSSPRRGRTSSPTTLEEEGFIIPPVLVDARPSEAFDPAAFRIAPVTATHFVQGGDLIDLGDRRLQVVDLPGHTPGSIGLWDERDEALYSGDAIYDGELIDTLAESSVDDYLPTMRRLRRLPVEIVYPGHDEPFGRERLRLLADGYLRRRGRRPG